MVSRVLVAPLWIVLLSSCAGGLDGEQLEKVVAAGQPALRACYDAALAEHPLKDELRFNAEIHITRSGSVESVAFDQAPPLPGLATCLEDAIGRWRFPSADKATGTSLPLVFQPSVVQKPIE